MRTSQKGDRTKSVPDSEPYLKDPAYRSRCLSALKGYYTTFGAGRTLQGYAVGERVYLNDVIELMTQCGVGMPEFKKDARRFLRKLKTA